ncbi:hypothetical protein PLICRDRAFT_178633 [Plicaturopsis crispa FD-325 SS-3]|nr:hypothetical protein PLICRDRAFT_178633 [Plicaturopsis crispa FD-325 SS-3]
MAPIPQGYLARRAERRQSSQERKESLPKKTSLTAKDLEGLGELVKSKFGLKYDLRQFQVDAVEAQLMQKDVLVHAGTGLGKTAIAAGPHAHPSAKGKVTIMVSPLLALHDEMAETFASEFGLKATAVNSSNGGCKPEVLKQIVSGDWQIVMISPEMLVSRRFTREVLKNAEFSQRILSVVIDEAHVVSHWGDSFRKKYGELGKVRAFLPRSTPFVALSATLAARVRHDVLTKLQFHKTNYVNIDVGNDRANVSIVVRGIQHPINTYADLDFIINKLVENPSDIPKTFVYCDNIAVGVEIIDHLTALLPERFRNAGLIRPYNAAFSGKYRKKVMSLFRDGSVRIMVCTDAAGMGCNIPDIDVVVQWKMPGSVSTFVQRAGRAGRGAGTKGLAVLLVEQSVYGVDPAEIKHVPPAGGKGKKQKGKTGTEPVSASDAKKRAAAKKARAVARGAKRGSRDGTDDDKYTRDAPPLQADAVDEGLAVLAQTGFCRRAVLTEVYANGPFETDPKLRIVPCCDLCDPKLLDRTRPGIPPTPMRQTRLKKGMPCAMVQSALHAWRMSVCRRDFAHALFSGPSILKDETLDLLSSVGPFDSRAKLQKVLGQQWDWEAKYGDELFEVLVKIDIPPLVVKPRALRGTKRGPPDDTSETGVPASSRARGKAKAKTTAPTASCSDSNLADGNAVEKNKSYVPSSDSQATRPASQPEVNGQRNVLHDHSGPHASASSGSSFMSFSLDADTWMANRVVQPKEYNL